MKDPLFEPIQIGNMTVKNRIYMPAMHLCMTKNFEVTDQLVEFYAERARGGAGMITVGYATVDDLSGSVFNPPSYNYKAAISKVINWSNVARKEGLLGLENEADREQEESLPRPMKVLGPSSSHGINPRDRGMAPIDGREEFGNDNPLILEIAGRWEIEPDAFFEAMESMPTLANGKPNARAITGLNEKQLIWRQRI